MYLLAPRHATMSLLAVWLVQWRPPVDIGVSDDRVRVSAHKRPDVVCRSRQSRSRVSVSAWAHGQRESQPPWRWNGLWETRRLLGRADSWKPGSSQSVG